MQGILKNVQARSSIEIGFTVLILKINNNKWIAFFYCTHYTTVCFARVAGADASSPGPEESGQDSDGVRAGVRRVLPALSHVQPVVLPEPQVPGRVQLILARVAYRRLLSVLQQLVHQSHRTLPGQRHFSQALRPAAVLVDRQAAGRHDHRVQERLHAPEERHPGDGQDHHQRFDHHRQHADEHVRQAGSGPHHNHGNHGAHLCRAQRRQHHYIGMLLIGRRVVNIYLTMNIDDDGLRYFIDYLSCVR